MADVPDWNPDFKGQVISGTVDRWFDPNAFKMPIGGTFGNVANSASYAFSPSAGTITSSATSTRQLQLALKLPF